MPPSLTNIHKELENSFSHFTRPTHGNLTAWTSQVLLLNSSLTVAHSKPAAHAKTGWNKFTEEIVNALIQRQKPLVFLSWGKHAHKITARAENTHHYVIKTSHPSPLGARKSGLDFDAFLGSKCFLKANDFLKMQNQPPIKWQIE
ncbi:uracil-DNA glycosylase [Psychromonas sp. MME2]|uniref:uracil-DNA glycosylase n=1 Tax=unclassified Psychromonas TaxID=2614957 RepID=UPI00339C2579